MGDCVFGEEEFRHSIISSSSGSPKRMETFLAPVLPWRVMGGGGRARGGGREMLALWDGAGEGSLQSPQSQDGATLGAPLVCHWVLCSIYPLCGDILAALKETVCSCCFYSVLILSGPAPYSSKTTALLLVYPHHPCVNSAHVEALTSKAQTHPDQSPSSWCSSRKAPGQVLSSQSALSDLTEHRDIPRPCISIDLKDPPPSSRPLLLQVSH